MPIAVVWDSDEQTIVVQKFTDPWDWTDFERALNITNQTLAPSVNHAVAVVNDISETRRLPTGALTQFRSTMHRRAPNVQWIVIAGANAYAEAMVAMFRQLYTSESADWFSVATLDDARALVARMRAESNNQG